MRNGPGTDYAVIAAVSAGQTITILESGSNGTWLHIQTENKIDGWIAASFIKVIGTPTAIATTDSTTEALAFISPSRNQDWKPFIQEYNGVRMALVPKGCFKMGNDNKATDDMQNNHTFGVADGGNQCFEIPFWIDETEVTNEQFITHNGSATKSSNWRDANKPREMINWYEARDYCEKRNARLPTEREWEYAARGPDSLAYPWGNDFIPDYVIPVDTGYYTVDVRSKSEAISWVGALNLSSNIWEWTASIYKPYPYIASDNRESTHNLVYLPRSVRGEQRPFTLMELRTSFILLLANHSSLRTQVIT